MRLSRFIIVIALLCATAFAAQPVIPPSFAGWQKVAGAKTTNDPATIDPANPGVLKEYGFNAGEVAQYSRDRRTLTARGARFNDASGAYGPFTSYPTPDMPPEQVG